MTPLDARLRSLSVERDSARDIALAALWHDWASWVAHPKQLAPPGDWCSLGYLTARGWGKTATISRWIQNEVRERRAMRICLCAQTETETINVLVLGESGLIATSPPWHKAVWEGGRVQWPNGAQALVFSPVAPGPIRGHEYHVSWLSELEVWQATTREEALSNVEYATRLGYGRILWDANPKRRHPLIRAMLQQATDYPEQHLVVRGTMRENERNLTRGKVEEMQRKHGGTQRGREELLGEYMDDAEGALWRQEWIDSARRHAPPRLARRIWSVDPAITARDGSDSTGLVDLGLGVDDQIYVLADRTAIFPGAGWAEIICDTYATNGCDLVIYEANRGGDLGPAVLRGVAKERGMQVVVLDAKGKSRSVPGTIYMRVVTSRNAKETRHAPAALLYEQGRVSHVIGADLGELEDTQCTWTNEKGAKSPDRLDALSQGVLELSGLEANKPRGTMAGIGSMREAMKAAAPRVGGVGSISAMLGGQRGGLEKRGGSRL